MNAAEALRQNWREEEESPLDGWDFSRLEGRVTREPLPWDYTALIARYRDPAQMLLDMGTGGGEFLRTLRHPYGNTCVTEGHPPNLQLCRERLSPLGITVKQVAEDNLLDFEDDFFGLVINRHEEFSPREVARVLKPGGIFLTQQVGGENNRALSARLILGFQPPFPAHHMACNRALLEEAGLETLFAGECYPVATYWDVGALVWTAKATPWEFPDFGVDRCLPQLFALQEEIDAKGSFCSQEHRFVLLCKKSERKQDS